MVRAWREVTVPTLTITLLAGFFLGFPMGAVVALWRFFPLTRFMYVSAVSEMSSQTLSLSYWLLATDSRVVF